MLPHWETINRRAHMWLSRRPPQRVNESSFFTFFLNGFQRHNTMSWIQWGCRIVNNGAFLYATKHDTINVSAYVQRKTATSFPVNYGGTISISTSTKTNSNTTTTTTTTTTTRKFDVHNPRNEIFPNWHCNTRQKYILVCSISTGCLWKTRKETE